MTSTSEPVPVPVTVVTPAPDPAPGVIAVRAWANTHAPYGNRIRVETCRMAQSALVRRWSLFGHEDGLNTQNARELAQLLIFVGGTAADYLAQRVCIRAIVEEDRELLQVFADHGACADQIAWLVDLESLSADAAAERIAGLYVDPEEHAATRLIVARRFPEQLTMEWLFAVPDRVPVLAAALAVVAARQRPDLNLSLASFLETRLPVLMALDPDAILAPLVRHSGSSPQTTLKPFAEIYGDATVVAAAEWHLEHQQADEARTLVRRLRPLGPDAESALLIAVLAGMELGDVADAKAARQAIIDPNAADMADIALAATPGVVSDDDLEAIAGRCRADQPERFLAVVRLLLARRRLDLARRVAQAQRQHFSGHPVLGPVLTQLGVGP